MQLATFTGRYIVNKNRNLQREIRIKDDNNNNNEEDEDEKEEEDSDREEEEEEEEGRWVRLVVGCAPLARKVGDQILPILRLV